VKLLGEVPRGLPVPSLPAVNWEDLVDLLPLALACFLLGAVETAAIGRMFAEKHGYRLDSNQEFLALAGANLASGLGYGFPVSGGMSQSLVNESAGARTPLSGLLCAIFIALVAVFFSDLLRNLPQPVLAAIVLMAVAGLLKVNELRHLWQVHRNEFLVAMVALLGVLWAGLLKGVLIGAIISLVMLIRRVSSPHVAFLGRTGHAARRGRGEKGRPHRPLHVARGRDRGFSKRSCSRICSKIVTATPDGDACENIDCLVPRCHNRIVPRHRPRDRIESCVAFDRAAADAILAGNLASGSDHLVAHGNSLR
jgi:MFS superfamily sulfate permease-like transporter